jgi:hypothetical protein
MFVYHRSKAAQQILKVGFRDGVGTYMTDREWRGVWFTPDPDLADPGDYEGELLEIDIPEELFERHEWKGEGKPYREALVPASEVNKFGPPKVVAESGSSLS